MPPQKYLGLQHFSLLKGLKLADIRAEAIKVLIGAGIPEVFFINWISNQEIKENP